MISQLDLVKLGKKAFPNRISNIETTVATVVAGPSGAQTQVVANGGSIWVAAGGYVWVDTGGFIRAGSDSAARVDLTSEGLEAYNDSNVLQVKLFSADGSFKVYGAGSVQIIGGGSLDVVGGNINVTSGAVNVTGTGGVSLTGGGSLTVADSGAILLTGTGVIRAGAVGTFHSEMAAGGFSLFGSAGTQTLLLSSITGKVHVFDDSFQMENGGKLTLVSGIVWGDNQGLWMIDVGGNPAFGISGVNGKSWGTRDGSAAVLDKGDAQLGYGTNYLWWDQSAGALKISGQLVVGSSNKLWLNDSNDGALSIGGTNKAAAPFRVSAAGALNATGATISGNITATSGSFTGTVSLTGTGSITVGGGTTTIDGTYGVRIRANAASIYADPDSGNALWFRTTGGTDNAGYIASYRNTVSLAQTLSIVSRSVAGSNKAASIFLRAAGEGDDDVYVTIQGNTPTEAGVFQIENVPLFNTNGIRVGYFGGTSIIDYGIAAGGTIMSAAELRCGGYAWVAADTRGVNPSTGTLVSFPTVSLAIGDNDSGLDWGGDGDIRATANANWVAGWTSAGFKSRYLLDITADGIGGLGSASGSIRNLATFNSNVGSNRVHLYARARRVTTGTDWGSTNMRLQRVSDTTDQSYVSFSGSSVGVNTDPAYNSSYAFLVGGEAAKSSGTSAWQLTSDGRAKDVRGDYVPGLKELQALGAPVRFVYNGRFGTKADGQEYVGYTAQHLNKSFPGMVTRGGRRTPWTVNYHELLFAHQNAVLELARRVEELERRLAALPQL